MKRIFDTLIFSLLAAYAGAQCNASFNVSITGNQLHLTNASTQSGGAYFYWSTPGGSPSNQNTYGTSNPSTVTYSSAGSYSVCVTQYDSAWACVDTFCGNITISTSAVTLTLTSAQDTCSQCIGAAWVSNVSGGTSPYTYLWSNSATNSGIASLCSGTYTVTVTDNNGQTATSSTYVSDTNFITAYINTSNNNPACGDSVVLTANVTNGNATYQWSTGASTASILVTSSGSYSVTATGTSGCSDAASINVSFGSFSIEGILAQGYNARIYLIEEDSGFLSALDSTYTDSIGGYYFDNLCNGTYYVKGALLPVHSQYSSYIPSYYDSVALWSNATALILNSGNINGVDFSLIPGTNTGGAGFVGGLISQGANRPTGNGSSIGAQREGEPIVNAQVMIFDASGMLVQFTKTDANGAYSFSNLALGNYKVQVDILNKTPYPYEVSLSSAESSYNGANFVVNSTSVLPATPATVEELVQNSENIYPNPTKDILHIVSDNLLTCIRIYNLHGELIMSQSDQPAGNLNVVVTDLVSGSYIIEFDDAHGSIQREIFIKE